MHYFIQRISYIQFFSREKSLHLNTKTNSMCTSQINHFLYLSLKRPPLISSVEDQTIIAIIECWLIVWIVLLVICIWASVCRCTGIGAAIERIGWTTCAATSTSATASIWAISTIRECRRLTRCRRSRSTISLPSLCICTAVRLRYTAIIAVKHWVCVAGCFVAIHTILIECFCIGLCITIGWAKLVLLMRIGSAVCLIALAVWSDFVLGTWIQRDLKRCSVHLVLC